MKLTEFISMKLKNNIKFLHKNSNFSDYKRIIKPIDAIKN